MMSVPFSAAFSCEPMVAWVGGKALDMNHPPVKNKSLVEPNGLGTAALHKVQAKREEGWCHGSWLKHCFYYKM